MAHIITAWLIVFVVRLCLILLGWNLGVVEVCPRRQIHRPLPRLPAQPHVCRVLHPHGRG